MRKILPVLAFSSLLFSAQLLAGTALAAPEVAVRSGDHPGFGRVVVDLAAGMRPSVARAEGAASVRIDSAAGPVTPVVGARPPRNVRALAVRDGVLELTLAPGATLRSYRLGPRLVLDVADPDPQAPAPAAAAPPAAVPPAASPVDPTRGRSADARHRLREDVPAPPLPAPAVEVAQLAPPGAAPGGLAATLAPDAAPPATVTLPFAPATGAAALRRGDAVLVVFDERRPIDLAALRDDPVLGGASIALLPSATVLRLPLAPERGVRLARVESGWTVSVPPDEAAPAPIRAEALDGRLRLAAAAPGQVVAVPDPLSGGTLLVGTQRGAGQAVAIERRSPEFALLPTQQGVAVLPLADTLALRPQADGFLLAASGRALSLSAPDSQTRAMTEAATASRRFDLPGQTLETLHQRLQSARLAAAAAPPRARTAHRRAVAEAMLALGLGPEMQAVLGAAVAEDARAAEDPDIAALAAIAALLSGRTDQADAIAEPRQDGSDEIAFWRAVRVAQRDPGSARAAAMFGSAMPLLLSYPLPLRDRLLPTVLETMARGGEAAAAGAVAARFPEMASLDLARAVIAERAGDAAAALALYDRVAAAPDRRARAVAARQAVELRLAAGALSPQAAADALERLVFAWRGDGAEIATRLRIAELRAQSGAWRTALALVREVRQLFPEQEEAARRALGDIFARSLAPEAQEKLSPLDLVALAEENADLLPTGPAGHALAARLADRLLALDLPERAMPVLEKLIEQAPPGIGRATLGASLAGLRLERGDAPGALAALSASVVEGALPPELLERRTLVFARAAAAGGDMATATAALAELGTPAALLLRAELLERARDWPAAGAALSALLRAGLPAEGMLDAAQQRLVLRLAAAAVQAGDERQLAALRSTLAPRLSEEGARSLAALLAAAPVRGVADLPRAAQEARLARAAPAALRGLGP